jgi:hypothetical protein
MKPIRFLPALLFLVNIVLGAGLTITIDSTTQPGAQQRAIPTLANEQRTILLIVVDKLGKDANLAAVWTLIYAPTLRSPTWIPIYPALPPANLTYADQLFSTFHLVKGNHPDPAFLDLLRQHNLAWSGYIVLDGEAILETMAYFDIPTRPRNQTEWLTLISVYPQGYEAALHNQIDVLNSICTSAAAQTVNFDLLKLFPRLRKHLQADIDLNLAFSEWEQFFSSENDLKCQFPNTPEYLP